MSYTPTNFTRPRDGKTATAYSWRDHWQFTWEGYFPVGAAPEPDPHTLPASKGYVDDAVATAETIGIPNSQKGSANGVATLDSGGKVPDAQIPAAITRDAEMATALASKADLVSGVVPDAQIPAAITRDAEMATALAAKADLVGGVVPDAQIPSAIARDTEVTAAVAAQAAADAVSYAPQVGYSDLLPWFVALGGRETKRANIVMIGASVTEGVGVTVDQTQAQRLATTLRGRFPTRGLSGGGRGHIGQPASATSYPWTYGTQGTLAASAWDETFHIGMNHRARVLKGDGSAANYNWAKITLSGAVTSFDISHTKTSLGGVNYGYYKIDGGAAVAFSTNASSPTPELLHIASAATSTIEIGCLAGSLYLDGVVEYAGDENKGIQVHNCGHGSYTTANWDTNATTAGSWAFSIALLQPDLIVISDLGVNDYVTSIGNKTSAQFKTDMLSLITHIRAAGMTCPIILAANYKVDYSGFTYVEPWANYVAKMKEIADADSTVVLVDHNARMPSSSSNSLGIIGGDQIHPTAKGYGLMADTLVATIGSR